MRIILYIIQKEFKQILRDKFMRTAIVMIPIIQMIVLVYAATFELKEVQLYIANYDEGMESLNLMNKFRGSTFFKVKEISKTISDVDAFLLSGEAQIVMKIPENFSQDLGKFKNSEIQLLIDAVDGMASQLALTYTKNVVLSFSKEIMIREFGIHDSDMPTIDISTRNWYNPLMDYKIFMAPGILVILVTAIGWFMAGMNLVKEKETGTIEQLNVSPIRKYQFLAGKLVPFLVIGLFDLSFGLLIAKILFNLPFEGSLFTLFIFTSAYLITVLGIGLFISTISNTQQQVLFVSFFFMMAFVLMSGLFTAIENMPEWGQRINTINPLAYFAKVIRMVILKGSSLADIRKELLIMLSYAFIINILAVWRYRKTT